MEEHPQVPEDDVQGAEEIEDVVEPEDDEDALFDYLFGREPRSTASGGSDVMALTGGRRGR
jgi:hypothetical protein